MSFSSKKMSKQERVLNQIKLSFVRLFFISIIWMLFFHLYSLSGLDEPSFKPVVLGFIGLYIILEAVIIIGSYWVDIDENEKDPDINANLRKLAESLQKAPQDYQNGETAETDDRKAESCLP